MKRVLNGLATDVHIAVLRIFVAGEKSRGDAPLDRVYRHVQSSCGVAGGDEVDLHTALLARTCPTCQ